MCFFAAKTEPIYGNKIMIPKKEKEEMTMAERVTIQDIADALGLSRNTVSKAINNTGSLADATREKILQKAVELGYKQFSYMSLPDMESAKDTETPANGITEISLFTRKILGNSHFASPTLDKFQKEITKLGYHLTMYSIPDSDAAKLLLPQTFSPEKSAGIICFEMFEPAYSKMLCTLNIPILFVDTPAALIDTQLEADLLYMDNRTGILSFVNEMVKRGNTTFGYVGQILHCQSFYERYAALREGLELLGLPFRKEYSILDTPARENPDVNEHFAYRNYVLESLKNMKELPDVFLCANDFVAIDLLQSLKQLGFSVPKDVFICGFDDSPESRILTPTLTTIHIHSQIIGITAAELLISRIREPSLNFRTVHTETTLIYRESTGD